MELAVATVFVSPVVKILITKVSTYASDQIGRVWGIKGDLEKLAETLECIEAVLHDAEKRQLGNDGLVKLWLEKLKDVVYDAEDALALLEHKDLRRKMKKKTVGVGHKIADRIKDINKKLDVITNNMEKFKFIIQLGGSSSKPVMNENRLETDSHINDLASVVGRKDDVSEILDLLIDSRPNYNQESYSVVRITGMGGIGKTTLAQLVFKKIDDKHKDHFKVKKWVSVSRKSDVKEIFGDLLEANKERKSSLETIKNRLKEILVVGKCLIILDDVWINHGIEVEQLLKDLLSMSCDGSKILMTMRSAEPIPTGCPYKIHPLHVLLEDDCWSMIKKTAFGHGGAKETEDLIDIGKQIARKCGGLPLAAKTLGGLLYSRDSEEEWSEILNSDIWSLPSDENKIISILKLSYDELSPYVKRCFSYCSIFPKGHLFDKKQLILMWMAEGFLSSRRQPKASPETLGNTYFKILLLNSFFQEESRNIFGDFLQEETRYFFQEEIRNIFPRKSGFRMHDLVHDLAMSVAGSDSRMVKGTDPEVTKPSNKFRRLGIKLDRKYFLEIKASKLHTLVFSSSAHEFHGAAFAKQIFSFSLLRVLKCAGIKELPESICKLKYLRYLDLSGTIFTTLPSSFSELYNLQTLRLKGCNLKELPEDMAKLIGLEYFSYSISILKILLDGRINWTRMPKEVSRLSKLKKLSLFVVGVGKGYGIEELKDLNLLGGKLIIQNLERVTDAKQANLMGKNNITHLNLCWDEISSTNRLTEIWQICRTSGDMRVLDDLQPHRNLRKLEIQHFGGLQFPPWMSTSIHLPKLVSIDLVKCTNCKHLPALGQLRSLRVLHMSNMGAIKKIGGEFYQSKEEASSNEEASFPSLVELSLWCFPNLEEWFGDQRPASTSSFALLETLKIIDCPNLYTTPTRFQSLKNLDFKIEERNRPNLKSLPLKLLRSVLQTLVVGDCYKFVGFLQENEEQKQQVVSFLPDNDEEQQHYQPDDISNNFLTKIEIYNCRMLKKLPADIRGLNSLTYLAIKDCISLKSLPDGIQCLPALRTLIIEGCISLQSLPDGIQYLPALQTLRIGGFSYLESFPFPAATGSDGEPYFVSLRELTICGWPSLEDVLPDQLQLITSLQNLEVNYFPCLRDLPEWFGELSSLQTLDIENCIRLECLPSEEQMIRLTSLQILTIGRCRLQERCRPGNEESHKLAEYNLTKDGIGGSKYERMGDTMSSRKSRKGKEKLYLQ